MTRRNIAVLILKCIDPSIVLSLVLSLFLIAMGETEVGYWALGLTVFIGIIVACPMWLYANRRG